MGTGRLSGDIHAPLSYAHAAGRSGPNHLALDLEIAANMLTFTLESSRLDVDNSPFCVTLQCSLAPQPVPTPGADGNPLPGLSWEDFRDEAHVQALDVPWMLASCWQLRAASHRHVSSCQPLSWQLLGHPEVASSQQCPGPRPVQKRKEHKPFI